MVEPSGHTLEDSLSLLSVHKACANRAKPKGYLLEEKRGNCRYRQLTTEYAYRRIDTDEKIPDRHIITDEPVLQFDLCLG